MFSPAFRSRRVQFMGQGIQVAASAGLLARAATHFSSVGACAPAQLGNLAATAGVRGKGVELLQGRRDLTDSSLLPCHRQCREQSARIRLAIADTRELQCAIEVGRGFLDPALRRHEEFPLSDEGRAAAAQCLEKAYNAEPDRWKNLPSILDCEPWAPPAEPEEGKAE